MSLINLKTNSLNNKRKNELYEMYKKSYNKIGATWKKNAIFNYYTNALVFKDTENKNRAAILYWPAGQYGKKVGLVFGTNAQFMKNHTIPHLASMLGKNTNWYAELSDALEAILTKNKYNYKLQPITNKELIRRITGLENLAINNTGQYERDIPGVGVHKKRLYGNPRV